MTAPTLSEQAAACEQAAGMYAAGHPTCETYYQQQAALLRAAAETLREWARRWQAMQLAKEQEREAPADVVRAICERMIGRDLRCQFPGCWCSTPMVTAKGALNALIHLGWRPPEQEGR